MVDIIAAIAAAINKASRIFNIGNPSISKNNRRGMIWSASASAMPGTSWYPAIAVRIIGTVVSRGAKNINRKLLLKATQLLAA